MADCGTVPDGFDPWLCWARCRLWEWQIFASEPKGLYRSFGQVCSPIRKWLKTCIDLAHRSEALIQIASQHQPHSTVVADTLNLPHPKRHFDFAISIAVVHHLSTRERRVKAIEAILDTLKSNGKALIYVWALEQKNSRRGWDAGGEQDVMVPWVTKKGDTSATAESTKTYLRYYHLYQSNELEADIAAAGGRVLDHGYEKDNWWAICSP